MPPHVAAPPTPSPPSATPSLHIATRARRPPKWPPERRPTWDAWRRTRARHRSHHTPLLGPTHPRDASAPAAWAGLNLAHVKAQDPKPPLRRRLRKRRLALRLRPRDGPVHHAAAATIATATIAEPAAAVALATTAIAEPAAAVALATAAVALTATALAQPAAAVALAAPSSIAAGASPAGASNPPSSP